MAWEVFGWSKAFCMHAVAGLRGHNKRKKNMTHQKMRGCDGAEGACMRAGFCHGEAEF